MVGDTTGGCRVKVTAELIVDITDAAVVRSAALAAIDQAQFSPDPDSTEDDARAAERERVTEDPASAVDWLVDTSGLLDATDGLTFVQGSHTIEEVDGDSFGNFPRPDFAQLFPLCHCGQDACDKCGDAQLSPRTAAALWATAEIHADQGYDDVQEHGDDPVTRRGTWALFNQYPRLTWQQNAVWRRQAARAFDDLAGDLASGKWPQPTCPAEEMALHLVLREAEAAVSEGWDTMTTTFADLPAHTDDFAWPVLSEVLLQDYDILHLFEDELDGIEDPDSEDNRATSIGDYRPGAWFDTFQNMSSRDGRRPFRR
jgi:hypothetical protein